MGCTTSLSVTSHSFLHNALHLTWKQMCVLACWPNVPMQVQQNANCDVSLPKHRTETIKVLHRTIQLLEEVKSIWYNWPKQNGNQLTKTTRWDVTASITNLQSSVTSLRGAQPFFPLWHCLRNEIKSNSYLKENDAFRFTFCWQNLSFQQTLLSQGYVQVFCLKL